MSRIVQEKFEVRPAQRPEGTEGGGWASDSSARTRKGLQTRAPASGRYESYNGDGLNDLPPGMNIEDQDRADIGEERNAGDLMTGTQATSDVNRTSLKDGFDRKSMRPTDDMYTREHNDAFYDSVEMDGVEGFVERNNYLDRL
jgi:hypothetical protein